MPVYSLVHWSNLVWGMGNKHGNVGKGKSPKSASLWSRARESQSAEGSRERERGRQRERGRGRSLQTNWSHAFQSSYRWMKYELQLIFLPGVIVLCILCPLDIYLGSKLTSFCGVTWAVQSLLNHRDFTVPSFPWHLSLPKPIGKGNLDKDMEQCNYWCNGRAGLDQGTLSIPMCQGNTNSIAQEEGLPSRAWDNLGLLTSPNLSQPEEKRKSEAVVLKAI